MMRVVNDRGVVVVVFGAAVMFVMRIVALLVPFSIRSISTRVAGPVSL